MTGQNRSFDDLVAALAPRVLEEAMEQAVAQARDEIADRLASAVVDRALYRHGDGPDDATVSRPDLAYAKEPDEVRGEAQPAAPRATPAVQSSGEDATRDPHATALYAFAIIPARPVDLAGVPGIDGETPLRIVQRGDLGLVVSTMRLDLMDDVSEDDLSENGALATLARRHDEVIRAVFEHGPVLPLRFGTVVADEDGARRLLDEQETSARRRLAHVATHREWGVRLSQDDSAEPQEEPDHAAERRREMTGTSYLASRREALQESQRAEQQTAALVAHAEEALDEHAVDVVRRGGGPGSALLTDLAYLVPDSREDSFLTAAKRLRGEVAREGLLLELTGPWPPYSFASLQDDRPGVVGSA